MKSTHPFARHSHVRCDLLIFYRGGEPQRDAIERLKGIAMETGEGKNKAVPERNGLWAHHAEKIRGNLSRYTIEYSFFFSHLELLSSSDFAVFEVPGKELQLNLWTLPQH